MWAPAKVGQDPGLSTENPKLDSGLNEFGGAIGRLTKLKLM